MRRLAPLVLTLTACATAGPSGPKHESQFPSQASLQELAARPAPALVLPTDVYDPETWPLQGPFAPDHALYGHPPTHPWEHLLAARLTPSGGAALATEGMHCVARNLAQLYVEHGGQPALSARTYAAGRCRAQVSHVETQTLSGDVPEKVSDAELFKQWRGQLEQLVRAGAPDHFEAVGLALARANGKATFVVARGERRAVLESVAVSPTEVVVRGQLLVADGAIRASINHGDFGYAACVAEGGVRLPQFVLRCPWGAGDTQSWVQIASFPPGRYLGRTALNVLVSPGQPSDTYARRELAVADGEVSRATLAPRFLEAVNVVRTRAGLEPLRLEAKQSELATQLAPHYFEAERVSRNPEKTDLIYLGLRAGWSVQGMVRYGLFGAIVSLGSRDLRLMLGELLDLPLGRESILDPAVKRVALGPLWSEQSPAMGMLFSTYALYGGDDPAALAEAAVRQLNLQRSQVGLAPVKRLAGLGDGAKDRATEAVASGQTPDQALNSLMASASRTTLTAVQGYWLTTDRVEALEWPADLVRAQQPEVHVSVTWYQPADEPWGRFVIFCVYPSSGIQI
jgi:hypothetical protein